eukprot:4640059-Amphidinium_carterae.1
MSAGAEQRVAALEQQLNVNSQQTAQQIATLTSAMEAKTRTIESEMDVLSQGLSTMVNETRQQFATLSSSFDGKLDNFAEKLLSQLSQAKKRDHQGMDLSNEGGSVTCAPCASGFEQHFQPGGIYGLYLCFWFECCLNTVPGADAAQHGFTCISARMFSDYCIVVRSVCLGFSLMCAPELELAHVGGGTQADDTSARSGPVGSRDKLAQFLANMRPSQEGDASFAQPGTSSNSVYVPLVPVLPSGIEVSCVGTTSDTQKPPSGPPRCRKT